jgi:4-hydroxy-tetrahydrodipicolinate reductase
MNPLRVAITGCTGQMGRALLRLASGDPAFQVVAAATVPGDLRLGEDAGRAAGLDLLNVPIATEIRAPCDALIEFTSLAGCEAWARWCAAHSVPLVSGTTGLGETQRAALRAAAEKVPVVWAPNMSVGVNLLFKIVADLAAQLDLTWDVEIEETHRRRKADAPSGTARALLEEICRVRAQRPADVAAYGREGQCGPRPVGQIGVHALRMGAIVGEHEVHFTSDHESLTLRHRAFSRDAFAAGALRAVRWLQGRKPGLYSMCDVLGV